MRGIRENSNGRRASISCSKVGCAAAGVIGAKGYDFVPVMGCSFSGPRRASYAATLTQLSVSICSKQDKKVTGGSS